MAISINYEVEHDKRYRPGRLTLYRVTLLAFQPIAAENSAENLHANNSKTIQRRAMNLTSLDFCESIFVYLKPIILVKT